MREKIWRFVIGSLPEGIILPKWAVAIRWVLFPLDSFYWLYSRHRGYQFYRDTWLIHGTEFSDAALYALSKSEGQSFKVTKNEYGVICLERLDS